MFTFPTKTLNSIKRVLLRQQKEVEENIKEIEEEDPVKGESVAESSEPGTDSSIADSHTKTLVLEHQLKNVSTSIKAALSKITRGIYGKCEKCGGVIENNVLEIDPETRFCQQCKLNMGLAKK